MIIDKRKLIHQMELRPDDTVRVLREADSNRHGWMPEMEKVVGRDVRVASRATPTSIHLVLSDSGTYTFSPLSLFEDDDEAVRFMDSSRNFRTWRKLNGIEASLTVPDETLHDAAMRILAPKVGDYMEVVAVWPSRFGGWTTVWNVEMNKAVDKVGRIVEIDGTRGVRLRFEGDAPDCCYPATVLRRIEVTTVKLNDSYTAKVTPSGIEVGCQTFDLDTFDKLAKAVAKVRTTKK